jgi:hypothetical protein
LEARICALNNRFKYLDLTSAIVRPFKVRHRIVLVHLVRAFLVASLRVVCLDSEISEYVQTPAAKARVRAVKPALISVPRESGMA